MKTMYIQIEDNPNCSLEERVFSIKSSPKNVLELHVESATGQLDWWEVIGLNQDNQIQPAQAVMVEDSGCGLAWLIFGGTWGLRFRPKGSNSPWTTQDLAQWGSAFKVLDSSGTEIRFETAVSAKA